MNKKFYLVIFLILVFGVIVYWYFFREEKPSYNFAVVEKGNIYQEVSATGTVTPAKKIDLQFKTAGKIEGIFVKVGDKVTADQPLMRLDTGDLELQFQQAQASLDLARAKLDQLLAGASEEQIRVSESQVQNAQKSVEEAEITLKNAQQNLEDVKKLAQINLSQAETSLNQAYEKALATLNSGFLTALEALNTNDEVLDDKLAESTLGAKCSQCLKDAKSSRITAKESYTKAKPIIDKTNQDSSPENIEAALNEVKSVLEKIYTALSFTYDTLSATVTTATFTDSYLSTLKIKISTAMTNVNNAIYHKMYSSLDSSKQEIASAKQNLENVKLTNQKNINSAQSQVESAQSKLELSRGNLKTAQENLTLIKAKPRETDIALYQAQIRQQEAALALIEKQIADSILKSPTVGTIIKISGEAGEIAKTGVPVITMIGESKFQIKADIYEEDIVKIAVGNPVDIALAAFSREVLRGRVSSIDPAEKLVGGVVYYEATIDFEEERKDVKPGMTADIVIKTVSKENILVIPKEAIQKKNGRIIVRVLKDNLIEDREIKIGLEGRDDKVEVISGLEAGEEVIVD